MRMAEGGGVGQGRFDFPDFFPGQIPDSEHIYEVYGVNKIVFGRCDLFSRLKEMLHIILQLADYPP